jgi:hypothetical protein
MVIINKRHSLESAKKYINNTPLFTGCIGVTIHHTGQPSLADRPDGLLNQHVLNIKDYYETKVDGAPWKSGPHFFIDDAKESPIIAFSPISSRGTHARGFNGNYIGIEMLGNYDVESPKSSRGIRIFNTTAALAALICRRIGVAPSFEDGSLTFHRHSAINPSGKTCPGTKVKESDFLKEVMKTY